MAKILYGPLISEARNAVGSVVFSRNHQGPFIRARVIPSEVPSTARTAAQDNLAFLMDAWKSVLTQAQRDAWNRFALTSSPRPGPVYAKKNPGLNYYIQHNYALQRYFTRHDDPPTNITVTDCGGFTGLSLNSDTPIFLVDVNVRPDANHALMIYASAPQTHGRSSNKLAYYAMAQLTVDDFFPSDIYPQYGAFVTLWNLRKPDRHDPIDPQDRVFLKAHMISLNTGATSQDFFTYVDNVPTGGDAMLVRTTTMTNAQVKALPTTPFEIVPAPGAGKLLVLHQAIIDKKTVIAAYTGLSASSTQPYLNIQLANGDPLSSYSVNDSTSTPALAELTDLMDNSNMKHVFLPWQQVDTSNGWGIIEIANMSAAGVNQAMQLHMVNAAGNLTGGNAANTWIVTVYYSIQNS